MRLRYAVLLLATLGAGGCDFDQSTNPNSPDPIGDDPSRAQIAASAIGVLLAFRQDVADFALDLGIVGREVLRFDGSDPRFTRELLVGPLDPGGDAFGGDHWADQYNAILAGNRLLAALPTASELSDAEKAATAGYVRTLQAYNFLMVLAAHTQDSIPIDVGVDPDAPPAPFVSNAAAYDHVVSLLEQAKTDLQNGGAAFPFSLPPGFAGFDTPPTFLQFNRALRARVAVYRGDYSGALAALAESFLVLDPGQLQRGVYMDYGTGAGDLPNPLAVSPTEGENFAHPQLDTLAQLQADGVSKDRRFLTKVVTRTATTVDGFTSYLGWSRYPSPTTPIPLIKNEELILLRAEANIGLNDLPAALADINFVREHSGGLAPLGGFADQDAAIDELLYNRLFSLAFEGAHRWIDLRRHNRLSVPPLPSSRDPAEGTESFFSTLPIPRDEVLARQ
ncbi:MAG TPA: RagB/SusD family nutrient uptake outer membrane protein [Gemmatimonadales bacterium]|nr:RagB/SusD family nutrient uptake outer membrane protein [Gemmatimonadales bacterium]